MAFVKEYSLQQHVLLQNKRRKLPQNNKKANKTLPIVTYKFTVA